MGLPKWLAKLDDECSNIRQLSWEIGDVRKLIAHVKELRRDLSEAMSILEAEGAADSYANHYKYADDCNCESCRTVRLRRRDVLNREEPPAVPSDTVSDS